MIGAWSIVEHRAGAWNVDLLSTDSDPLLFEEFCQQSAEGGVVGTATENTHSVSHLKVKSLKGCL